jgi:opacity protein-like surface antigen
MKKIYMIAVLAIFCLTANAQKARHLSGDITIQPMIGVSEGILSGKYNNFIFRSDDPRTGLTIGAEGEYFTNTRNLSLTAGLLYTQQGWMGKGDGPQTTKLNFINVPLMVNFYVLKGLALKLGLQMGFRLTATEGNESVGDLYEGFNLGLPIGVSYEFKSPITLDLRYIPALTPINKDSNSDWKMRSDVLTLTIGYKFELFTL